MASGSARRLVWNTRELVTSTDLNRAQAFAAYDFGEAMRHWLDIQGDVGTQVGTKLVGAPPSAEVLNGLLPVPQLGGTVLLIEPGAVMMVDPDGSPNSDDSPYKLIVDPGISVSTPALQLTNNGGASTRIDVIECSRADTVLETANVNIYDVATGNFSPSSLTKVAEGRLTYRIRLGVVGGGLPAPAAGWLPLAVVSVPTGATKWDDVSLWDVRPLVTDRVLPSKRTSGPRDHYRQVDFNIDRYHAPPKAQMHGSVECELFGYRLGGTLRPGAPGALEEDNSVGPPSLAYIDLQDTNNHASDFGVTADTMAWAYLGIPVDSAGKPFGARWVKYVKGTTSMAPREPRGIFAVSPTSPVIGGGSNPLLGPGTQLIKPPASTGLDTGTLQMMAVCIGGLWQNSGPEFVGGYAAGRKQVISFETATENNNFPLGLVNTVLPATDVDWTLTDLLRPPMARSVIVRLSGTLSAAEKLTLYTRDMTDSTKRSSLVGKMGKLADTDIDWVVEIPLQPIGIFSISPHRFRLSTLGVATVNALSIRVLGWTF